MGASASSPEQVAVAIRGHQVALPDWRFAPLASELHRWVQIFDSEFKLDLQAYPVLGFAPLRNAYATYRASRGEFGTKDNITFNTNAISSELPSILATLCHELIHLWQQYGGRPGRNNDHNVEFRKKASECGLQVDRRGCHSGYTAAFTELLTRHGLSLDPLRLELEASTARLYGTTPRPLKMRKWSCECTRVRCAVELQAVCRGCNTAFRLGEYVAGGRA